MNKRIKRAGMSAMLAMPVVGLAGVVAAAENPIPSLPCSIQVTEEKIENLPDYMGPRNPIDMDFPYCPVMIDGEYWVIYKNGGSGKVVRFKGTNIEDSVRQPDGTASFPQVPRFVSLYMLGGMWYDAAGKKLYSPMHCERGTGEGGYTTGVLREIHLATSTDKGLTWNYEGPIVTRDEPGKRPLGPEFSGLQWDGGAADHYLFVDERSGYFYLFSGSILWPKTDSPGVALGRRCVARCVIADKMTPGKWWKFYNGAWEQPGLGGKASYVNGLCVTYNRYLKKYISFSYSNIAFCDDLSKQDWSPSFPLGTNWCVNGVWGIWAVNAEKNNVFHSGEAFFVYSFWRQAPGRRFRVTLDKNGHAGALPGFDSPSFSPVTGKGAASADPGHYYGYTPLFESSDPIEARRARRVGCASAEVKYAGKWWDNYADSYEGKVKRTDESGASLEFTFKGRDIYWRAVKGPYLGKADVYLDGVLQTTVDCWASQPIVHQFAFIKQGMKDGNHTIKVVVKSEKNPYSTGAGIQHMLFEYSADTYRASDCFTSIQGKNQWFYQQREGEVYTDLTFTDPNWRGAGRCQVGYFHMVPDVQDAVRKWVAPHDGNVRIEGAPSLEGTNADGFAISFVKNTNELWSARLLSSTNPTSSHDTTIAVRKGDAIAFIVHKLGKDGPGLDVVSNNGPVLLNTSKGGKPMKIGTNEFTRGLFCQAVSKVIVRLPGPGKTFSAVAGADTNIPYGNPVLSVTVGGKTAFKLGVNWGEKKAVPVNVDLGGASEFVLEVGDGGNGNGHDWADWGDARVILADGREIWLSDLPLNQARVLWDPVITYVESTGTEK